MTFEVIPHRNNSERYGGFDICNNGMRMAGVRGFVLNEGISGIFWLDYIGTDKDYAGEGLGTLLLRTIAEYAAKLGMSHLVGDFQPEHDRNAAELWYKKRRMNVTSEGYEVIGLITEIIAACARIELSYKE